MNWIAVKDKKPDKSILAIVTNTKGWMYHAMAIYHPDADAWVIFNAKINESYTLEVTHYIEIPPLPEGE